MSLRHGVLLRVLGSVGFAFILGAGAVAASGADGAALGADALRAVAGDRAVARLEDAVYGVRDELDRAGHGGERPVAEWAVPAAAAPPPGAPSWDVRDVGPMYDDFAAEGDGVWVPVATASDATVMKKALLHPDRTRARAELFVVAIDLSATSLHYVPGVAEPENVAPGADRLTRRGVVPEADRDELVAAFNGGFKTRHGRHGVEVGGATLVPMRAGLCTFTGNPDGTVSLGSLAAPEPDDARFVRQSGKCLLENGVRHPGLAQELTASWGAAVGGDTVIRRSAVGISEDGRTLFVGVSNRTTATALTDGMRHAGAHTAAQLDVNEAFPRFLTYAKDASATLVAESIARGFNHRPHHYLDAPSSRDFFYVTMKARRLATADRERPSGT